MRGLTGYMRREGWAQGELGAKGRHDDNNVITKIQRYNEDEKRAREHT